MILEEKNDQKPPIVAFSYKKRRLKICFFETEILNFALYLIDTQALPYPVESLFTAVVLDLSVALFLRYIDLVINTVRYINI